MAATRISPRRWDSWYSVRADTPGDGSISPDCRSAGRGPLELLAHLLGQAQEAGAEPRL